MKPTFPPAAVTTNVYGQVQIAVRIDETGRVTSANVLSGHPLLRTASVQAALQSVFEPLTISGQPVRVNGIINYNFLPKQWNWLEIAFTLRSGSSYYSAKNLSTQFPPSFRDEIRLLDQAENGNADWDEAVESVIAIIRSKLSIQHRSSWLFETGLAIAGVKNKCCRFDDENQRLSSDLNILVNSAPEGISTELLISLRQMSNLIENRKQDSYSPAEGSLSYRLLNEIEQKFPFRGR